MTLTFENLIERNKRRSVALIALMILFLTCLGGLFNIVLYDPDGQYTGQMFSNGAIIGASLAIAGSLLSYFLGSRIVALISDARPVERHQDPVLFNVVEEMAIAGGIPTPKVYAIYDESPNAFASGRDPQHAIIGITSGLRKKLTRDELQAVVAHEMSHIKNYDIRLMMLISVFAGIIVLLSDLFLRHFLDTIRINRGPRGRNPRMSGKGKGIWYSIMFVLFGIFLAWIAPVIAKLLQLATSREREYLADATAVKLCRNPEALASALKKIALDPEQLACDNRATEHMFIMNPNPKRRLANFKADSIWATHPPVLKRIARLNKLAASAT